MWVEGLRLQGFEWFWGVYGGSVYTESAMKSCGTESCGRFKASKKQQQELCWFISANTTTRSLPELTVPTKTTGNEDILECPEGFVKTTRG